MKSIHMPFLWSWYASMAHVPRVDNTGLRVFKWFNLHATEMIPVQKSCIDIRFPLVVASCLFVCFSFLLSIWRHITGWRNKQCFGFLPINGQRYFLHGSADVYIHVRFLSTFYLPGAVCVCGGGGGVRTWSRPGHSLNSLDSFCGCAPIIDRIDSRRISCTVTSNTIRPRYSILFTGMGLIFI
jgi:hypothetical protein